MVQCSRCQGLPVLKRPKTGEAVCKNCFFEAFEDEIHEVIVSNKLFYRGETVAIGASGGKDSTVLAYVLKTLNERYDYGVKFVLLSIDEGIVGYRDHSLKTVQNNSKEYQMDLKILSYKDLYGWTMDEVVAQVGNRSNCTYCGVFRRQALDRGCQIQNIKHVVTGHNADDIAETVLMNLFRGDIGRLERSTNISNGDAGLGIKRSKPLKYAYEKEIVFYAHFKNLEYFSVECTYSPEAFRGSARTLIKNLESIKPTSIIDIIRSAESFLLEQQSRTHLPTLRTCENCGGISSQKFCKVCMLLHSLNAGRARIMLEQESQAEEDRSFPESMHQRIDF